MIVPFTKASACGNDFLIIDGMHVPADIHEFSRRICDRHNGAGADGVEWLFPAQDADIRARLINADGSEAEISGKGRHDRIMLEGIGVGIHEDVARSPGVGRRQKAGIDVLAAGLRAL